MPCAESLGKAWYSIRPEIKLVYYLFRTIASLKFLDDVTASPSKFCLALVRTMQPTSSIPDRMEYWLQRTVFGEDRFCEERFEGSVIVKGGYEENRIWEVRFLKRAGL